MFRMYRNRLKKSRIDARTIIQLLSAVLLNGYAAGFSRKKIFTGKSKTLCVPVLNCYSCPGALGSCPIGALQAVLGGFDRKFPFYVLGTLLLFGIVLGRVVCGFLCPFGLVQDVLNKIPHPKITVPKKIDTPLRYVKYVILAVMVVLLPAFVRPDGMPASPYFCEFLCPAGTLEGGIPLVLLNPALKKAAGALFQWKLLLLGLILAGSIFIPRFFCRYLCPLGAFYSLFHRFSFYRLTLEKEKCVGCKKCEKVCPMEIEVTKNVNSPECIRCGRCRKHCPTKAIGSEFLRL